jgi:titin
VDVEVSDITKTSCKLTWSAPEFDGGKPVTGYYVEKLTGTRWIKVNKKPISKKLMTFDDLIEYEEYEFRVSAENEAGIGKPSDTSGKFKAKDPFDPPGRPDAPIVDEITAEEATVSWKAPSDDGGASITHYVLEMKARTDVSWRPVSKEISETKMTVPNLVEGREYEFRVTAANKAGPGQASLPSAPAKYVEAIIFTRELQDVTLTEAKKPAVLECEISKEGLKVEWFKGSKQLKRNEKYDIQANGKVHQLIIESATLEDAGDYSAQYLTLSTAAKLSLQSKSSNSLCAQMPCLATCF